MFIPSIPTSCLVPGHGTHVAMALLLLPTMTAPPPRLAWQSLSKWQCCMSTPPGSSHDYICKIDP